MKTLTFSNYTWNLKTATENKVGPGPNYFSDDEQDISVDEAGLHLRTRKIGNDWYSAEAVLEKPLGFGEYCFQLETSIETLDSQAVFAGFLYEDDTQEIDIEFSQAMAGESGGQYVIQPGHQPGNLHLFTMPSGAGTGSHTSHRIIWKKDTVEFSSWRGDAVELQTETEVQTEMETEEAVAAVAEKKSTSIATWRYENSGIRSPAKAHFIFNLWLYQGAAPRKADHVIIKNFCFKPL